VCEEDAQRGVFGVSDGLARHARDARPAAVVTGIVERGESDDHDHEDRRSGVHPACHEDRGACYGIAVCASVIVLCHTGSARPCPMEGGWIVRLRSQAGDKASGVVPAT
jgi:hypothetical protein